MGDHALLLPHFLRVARSVASARGVRSLALPLAASAAIGIGCDGSGAGTTEAAGAGGATTASSGSYGGAHNGLSSMPTTSTGSVIAGTGGGSVGVMVMPDGGFDAH
jgi:hypothetical protein